MLQLVTFDVAGTLIRPLLSVGAQYGQAITSHTNILCNFVNLEKSFKESYQLYTNTYPLYGRYVGLTCKSWWLSVFLDSLMRSQDISTCKHGISKMTDHKHAPLWDIDNGNLLRAFDDVYAGFQWEILPHASQLLTFLKEQPANISIGVITNSDDRVKNELQKSAFPLCLMSHPVDRLLARPADQGGLLKNIDFILTSSQCGFEKPDRRIYELALKTASNLPISRSEVTASQTLHIGDSLERDYYGAKAIGLLCLLLDPTERYANSGLINAQHCVKDLSFAQQHVEQMLNV